jgi:hypothetical protein
LVSNSACWSIMAHAASIIRSISSAAISWFLRCSGRWVRRLIEREKLRPPQRQGLLGSEHAMAPSLVFFRAAALLRTNKPQPSPTFGTTAALVN